MSDFRTSQLNHKKSRVSSQSGRRSNTLCVIVSRAEGLRNVLLYDKQNPYATVRLQDQEESTKVMVRAGQTPVFDDELWFSLEAVEETILYVNFYHQDKKESKLICSGEVDFSPALKKSTYTGYDAWFPLYYKGRKRGKVFLEISYYPKAGEVPIETENQARIGMRKVIPLPESAPSNFKNTSADKSRRLRELDEELPQLGNSKFKSTTTKIPNMFLTSFKSSSNRRIGHEGEEDSESESENEGENEDDAKANHTLQDTTTPATNSNWISLADNTIKFPKFLNNISFNPASHFLARKDEDNTFQEEFDTKCKLKVESPQLLTDRPKKLFTSDYEDDENDTDSVFSDSESVTTKWKRSVASRQEEFITADKRVISSITYKSDDSDESEEEFTLGEVVNFKSSVKSNANKIKRTVKKPNTSFDIDDEELRRSYQHKKLPSVSPISSFMDTDITSHSDDDDDIPPPPKHSCDLGSLFESRKGNNHNNTLNSSIHLGSSNVLIKPVSTSHNIYNRPISDDPARHNSMYDRMKESRRRRC